MSARRSIGMPAVLVAIGAAVAFGGAGVASAYEADRDCSDFSTQAAAQMFFIEHGGSASNNFDDLDADHDGIACESNPCPCSTAQGTGTETTPCQTACDPRSLRRLANTARPRRHPRRKRRSA
jgi:Excalibur calcium-binding domain